MLEALLEAGADPNVRLSSHLWYMEYTFGVLRGSGINLKGATPFWRAAYALDIDAMRLLKDYGADPSIPTMKPPERRAAHRHPRTAPNRPKKRIHPDCPPSPPAARQSIRSTRRRGSATGSPSPATRTGTCPTTGWRR